MVATLLQALSLFLSLTEAQQGLVNAALATAAGFATAAMVSADAALPALLAVTKAVIALLLGFGVHLPDTIQVASMALIAAAGAFFVRQNVSPAPWASNTRRSAN
jgi:hypothetical protein